MAFPPPDFGLKQGFVYVIASSTPSQAWRGDAHAESEAQHHVRSRTFLRKDIQMSDGVIYTACQYRELQGSASQ